ncbi:MAG: glycoside hydrolase family 99-like domain-containing protein [Clostridia bacterium]|nr:glycoside hydrolase family 99-like domain-containing protein [Clostridia bacterium]
MKTFKKQLLLGITAAAMLFSVSCNEDTADSVETTGTSSDTTVAPIVIEPKEPISRGEAYTLVDVSAYSGYKEGIASGWRMNNRGGVPMTSIEGGYGSLTDISEVAGTALIREFNTTDEGLLVFETSAKVSGNGFSLELHNDEDQPIYRLFTDDGWKLAGSDAAIANITETSNTFRILVDLDNNSAHTFINETDCGVSPLLCQNDDANLHSFRFATDDESLATAAMGALRVTANYAVNDRFSFYPDGALTRGWNGEGAKISENMLSVSRGSASKSFEARGGTVIAETEFLLSNGQSVAYALGCGDVPVVTFSSDDKAFYANGTPIYENYVKDLWYRIRLEADTASDSAKIRLNGRIVGEVPFAAATDYLDTVSVANENTAAVSFDGIRVFEKITHDDYVPAPVHPAGEDDYTIGMNICSLWREGTHYGWSTITPYPDAEPVLGYYDEGSPESADWEIKYMVEHGIDFQAFCWYAAVSDGPIRANVLSTHLHDGYMNAEYSDEMNYCLIWEASNGHKPKDIHAWKTSFVPYFIEHYFKDSRYMTIDNQLVLCIYGTSELRDALGSTNAVKEMLDYLEDEVKKLGFDGMIYLACGSSSDDMVEMGFDGSYAYNWGTSGYDVEVNKNRILSSAASASMYTVPTISVGFNSIPWHGIRYPMMTPSDFEAAHLWVRDEYLPAYAEKGTWQEKFLMLSTWNEYGEGTYIMPSAGNGGFGYLDALRTVYTEENADPALNTVPTAEQKERITHMFPQYRRLLRKTGYTDEMPSINDLETVEEITYTSKKGLNLYSIGNVVTDENGLSGYADGDALITRSNLRINAAETPYLAITIEAHKGTSIDLYFITDKDSGWSQSMHKSFPATTEGLETYLIDMSTVNTWTDTVTALRIDPGQTEQGAGDPERDAFRLVSAVFLKKSDDNPKQLIINDQQFEMQLPAETTADGTLLIPFDPKLALDYRLNTFYTWDGVPGTVQKLTLSFIDHTLIYTVGADTYLHNGAENPLGYTMYLQDGLPMLSPKQLCADVGYKYTLTGSIPTITTDQISYFSSSADRIPGQWEFNLVGDTENWSSHQMGLQVIGGTMKMTTTVETGDPILSYSEELNLRAEDYSTFEIRCRYKHEGGFGQSLCVYFTTNKDGNMSEAMTIRAALDSDDSMGEWEVYSVDLTSIPTWDGLIQQIRFDPFNCMGEMEIDYMRFLPAE